MKRKIYIETSVIRYLTARPNKNKIDYSRLQWWDSFGYPSELTFNSTATARKAAHAGEFKR